MIFKKTCMSVSRWQHKDSIHLSFAAIQKTNSYANSYVEIIIICIRITCISKMRNKFIFLI